MGGGLFLKSEKEMCSAFLIFYSTLYSLYITGKIWSLDFSSKISRKK